jgi:hypothetical protein
MNKKECLFKKNKTILGIIVLLFIIGCGNIKNKEQNEVKVNKSKMNMITKNKAKCYYDKTNGLFFKINDCSPNCLSVYDSTDSLLYSLDDMDFSIISVHKAYGERFFFIAYDEANEYEIWEIELGLKRIMQMDLDTSQINETNVLNVCSPR